MYPILNIWKVFLKHFLYFLWHGTIILFYVYPVKLHSIYIACSKDREKETNAILSYFLAFSTETYHVICSRQYWNVIYYNQHRKMNPKNKVYMYKFVHCSFIASFSRNTHQTLPIVWYVCKIQKLLPLNGPLLSWTKSS